MLYKVKEMLPKGYKLVYVTEFGSTLYGTNSENSDKDYKGIFIPPIDDLILGKASENFKFNTGNSNSKNSKNDIDIELWSVNKFFKLLKNGETGSIDLLFSMFREDTILFEDKAFTSKIKENYKLFLSKNMKAFIGYCLGQASKYGIKGSRYGDLLKFRQELDNFKDEDTTSFVIKMLELTKDYEVNNFKYIKVIEKEDKKYLSVLGKLAIENLTIKELKERTDNQLKQYGDRTKLALEGVDWKALSHAVRVLFEMVEIIETEFLVFPLKGRGYLKQIKYNSKVENLDYILELISSQLKMIEKLLEQSKLPEGISKSNLKKIDELLLSIVKGL